MTTANGDIRAATCAIADRAVFLEAIRAVAEAHNTHIICFNADMLVGIKHVMAALDHAIRSFREGRAISNTLEMEALLYAAGSRQCSIGASFGIHEGNNRLWVCCCPGPCEEVFTELRPVMEFVSGDSWNWIDPERQARLMKLFDISSKELLTLKDESRFMDLVLERVALLDVMR
ncbi:KEOPS complex subunit Cgi121 [Methanoregula sp.]|uniref:KEOPS complex subunit Cgi121 n=1 Tax=Methanoregula sp. TaxID=2052170 RepID=UPI00356AAA5F